LSAKCCRPSPACTGSSASASSPRCSRDQKASGCCAGTCIASRSSGCSACTRSSGVVAMLHRLMEAGLARQRDPDGVKFRPVVELTASGISVMKGESLPPVSLIDSRRPARAGDHSTKSTSGAATIRRVEPVEDEETPLTPEATRRFERLRKARSELATGQAGPRLCHLPRFAPSSSSPTSHRPTAGPSSRSREWGRIR